MKDFEKQLEELRAERNELNDAANHYSKLASEKQAEIDELIIKNNAYKFNAGDYIKFKEYNDNDAPQYMHISRLAKINHGIGVYGTLILFSKQQYVAIEEYNTNSLKLCPDTVDRAIVISKTEWDDIKESVKNYLNDI